MHAKAVEAAGQRITRYGSKLVPYNIIKETISSCWCSVNSQQELKLPFVVRIIGAQRPCEKNSPDEVMILGDQA